MEYHDYKERISEGRDAQMNNVTERFLRYVKVDTQSAYDQKTMPSTEKQKNLGRMLVRELQELGVQQAEMDEHGYVYAKIPASEGREHLPALGFIAHMDTSPAVSGANVQPRVIAHYDGSAVVLNAEQGIVMSPEEFPGLLQCIGKDLIVTDGTTLLGADDKAGVAEIMTMAERMLLDTQIRHGEICIAFTPDEEIGQGTAAFDIERFGAQYAYTVDGGPMGQLEYENFNAASAKITICGKGVHPGEAKNMMKNALLIAMELNNMLPAAEIPGCTDGYEGFYHLESLSGDVEQARLSYIIRDHDKECFETRKERMQKIAGYLNEKYGDGTIELKLRDSYYNMKEIIEQHYHLVERAEEAMRSLGIDPQIVPIRGGTDGATLSHRGLPCPDLGSGGYHFHSRYEFIPVQSIEGIVEILLKIAELYAQE